MTLRDARRARRGSTALVVAAAALLCGCADTARGASAASGSEVSSSAVATEESTPVRPVCGDVLANAGLPPVAGLRFRDCEASDSGQVPTLLASYDVVGDPHAVEDELVARFGMDRMVFRCCGWEPTDPTGAQFRTGDGYGVTVGMSSGETLEKDWSAIDFTVTVELALEDP